MRRRFITARSIAAASMIVASIYSGCHSHDHDHEHFAAHGAEGHAHDHPGRPVEVVTTFTDATELFAEFPVLVAGEESAFAVHLTRLSDYSPIPSGTVSVRLSGGGALDETFTIDGPDVPGIFRPVALPVHAGRRGVSLRLTLEDLDEAFDLGTFDVHQSSPRGGEASAPSGHGLITFLKEQQWKMGFMVEEVRERRLRASIPAYAMTTTRGDSRAVISAPLAGRVTVSGAAFPIPGRDVSANDILAKLIPRLEGAADRSSWPLELERARLRLDLDRLELERLERLLAEGAVALKRVTEAQSRVAEATAEFEAARRRQRQNSGLTRTGRRAGPDALEIRTPIRGVINRVLVAPGEFVEEGRPLFHVADLDELWLDVRVAEADLGRVVDPLGVWFEFEGFEEPFTIEPGPPVFIDGMVDPSTRTVSFIFEIDNPQRRLRAGMMTQAHIFVGEPVTAVAVPSSAILHEEGFEQVIVLRDGETFEPRTVRIGIRDAGWVQIKSGLDPGERIVTTGAYTVKLAGASTGLPDHGHAH